MVESYGRNKYCLVLHGAKFVSLVHHRIY